MSNSFGREPDTSSIRAALEWVREQGEMLAEGQGKPTRYGREVALIALGGALMRDDKPDMAAAISICIMHPPATTEGLDALQLALEEECND